MFYGKKAWLGSCAEGLVVGCLKGVKWEFIARENCCRLENVVRVLCRECERNVKNGESGGVGRRNGMKKVVMGTVL